MSNVMVIDNPDILEINTSRLKIVLVVLQTLKESCTL